MSIFISEMTELDEIASAHTVTRQTVEVEKKIDSIHVERKRMEGESPKN